MHLGGLRLNPLMRCHEQGKARDLTARFKASTPLRLPHLHLYQEGQCTRKELWLHRTLVDGKNIDVSIQTLLESPQFKHGRRGNDMNWECSKRSNNSLCHMGCLRGTLTHCLRNPGNPSCGLRRGHDIRCYGEALRGLTPTWILLTPTSTWQGFYIVWWLGFWNVLNCMLVFVFYMSVQAFTLVTSSISEWGRRGRLFLVSMLGLTTSRDGFWVILPWHNAAEQSLAAAYALAFTGKSNSKSLNVPYEFLHWRFSPLLNRKLFAPYHVRKCEYNFKG